MSNVWPSMVAVLIAGFLGFYLRSSSPATLPQPAQGPPTEVMGSRIKLLSPDFNEELAEAYEELIVKHCGRDIMNVALAILMQESGFYSHKINNGVDYGIGQINAPVWEEFFDIKNRRELLNPIVGIRLSCEILKSVKLLKGHKPDWWGYYHSWNREPRQKYVSDVKVYLSKLLEREAKHEQ